MENKVVYDTELMNLYLSSTPDIIKDNSMFPNPLNGRNGNMLLQKSKSWNQPHEEFHEKSFLQSKIIEILYKSLHQVTFRMRRPVLCYYDNQLNYIFGIVCITELSNAGARVDEIMMAVTGHKNKKGTKRYLHRRRDDQMYNLFCVLETARSGTNRSSPTMTAQTITSKSNSESGKRIVVEKDDTKVTIKCDK